MDDKSEKFVFDGETNAIIVAPSRQRGLVPDKFSLSFSMRHARGTKEEQAQKQHILCESDDSSKTSLSWRGILGRQSIPVGESRSETRRRFLYRVASRAMMNAVGGGSCFRASTTR